jgi:hypothetical protein
MRKGRLRDSESGIGAVEFALIAPVLLGMLVGIVQLGNLYFANADLRNAVAVGARAAQVFPRPSATVVENAIKDRLQKARSPVPQPKVTFIDNDASGFPLANIEVTYTVPLDFIIYRPKPVTLKEERRVYVQPI